MVRRDAGDVRQAEAGARVLLREHLSRRPAWRRGTKIKLVNNFLALGGACLIAEALAVAAKVGVDLQVLYKLISAGGANSNMFQMMVPKALAGDSPASSSRSTTRARTCATTRT